MHNGIPTPRKYDKEIESYMNRATMSDYIYNKNVKKILILGAEKSILDCVDFLVDKLSSAYDAKHETVYCYLAVGCSVKDFYAFCSIDNKMKELAEVIGNAEYDALKAETMEHIEKRINKYFRPCFELKPMELLLTIDPVEKKVHCLKTMGSELFNTNGIKRFNAWFKANGGKPKPVYICRTKFWHLLKYVIFGVEFGENSDKLVVDTVVERNPAMDAVELDLEDIRKRVRLAMEAKFSEVEEPEDSEENENEPDLDDSKIKSSHSNETAKMFREYVCELEDTIDYDYLEGDTGFLAIKAGFDEAYPQCENPAFLYCDNVADLRDEYSLPNKDYEHTLYEYIAIYEDEDSWHITSLGMSNLGAEPDDIYERYDAEYTMRIPKIEDEEMDEAEWANAINLVSVLADEACNKNRMLKDYSYVGLGFRKGVDYRRISDKVAFIIVPDARVSSVNGPLGTVHFRQAVPITRTEYNALKAKQIDVKTLYEKIGSDLTDYDRPSVI